MTDDLTAIELLEPGAADDAALVDVLARMVNAVYAVAERGLWRDGAARTSPDEMAGLVRAGEIVVARAGGRPVGVVRVHDVGADASEFGLLAAPPEVRGTGVGRALLDFVEGRTRDRGRSAMQLELLVPRTWSHPGKEFLRGWYGRRGYRLVRTGTLDADYPHLVPLLATPCDLEIHRKVLAGHPPNVGDHAP
jgi:GNAT superfamily N-acetyltransferase